MNSSTAVAQAPVPIVDTLQPQSRALEDQEEPMELVTKGMGNPVLK